MRPSEQFVADMVEPFDVPEIRVTGLAAIEDIDGWGRFSFYRETPMADGGTEKIAVLHIVCPALGAVEAMRLVARHYGCRLRRALLH